jgi:hypothetical protein
MRILVIHQNFPAQFYHLVGALARRGHDVVALGSCEQASLPEGVIYGVYSVNEPDENLAYHDHSLELALRRARKVRGACEQLRDSGWIADVVLFHCSWGEGLYLRDVWPDQRLVGYPELYGSQLALGYGFDKTLSSPPPLLCEGIRHINLLSLAAIADSDAMRLRTKGPIGKFISLWVILVDSITSNVLIANRISSDINTTMELRPGGIVVECL